MARKWTLGALTAVIAAIVTAMSVSSAPAWEVSLALSPLSLELSAPAHQARIVINF